MIKLQGKYDFDMIGDGQANEATINLSNMVTPHPFRDGLMPTGIVSVTANKVAVKSGKVGGAPIVVTDVTLNANKLAIQFQGAPLGAIEVTAVMSFGPTD